MEEEEENNLLFRSALLLAMAIGTARTNRADEIIEMER
jgi:hypothetical protein